MNQITEFFSTPSNSRTLIYIGMGLLVLVGLPLLIIKIFPRWDKETKNEGGK